MKTSAAAVIAALLSFIVGSVWVFARAGMFLQYFYETRMVALTHVFTLGWVSLLILGVLRQLAPVAFGLRLRRPGWIGAAVAVWIAGLGAMVVGFAAGRSVLAAAGVVLLFGSVVLLLGILLPGFRGIRWEPSHVLLVTALLFLGAAAVLGLWMGLSKAFDVPLPAPFHRVLFAHIHLAGAGWAGMMIFAVMSRFFPQPYFESPSQAGLRFIAFVIGLVGLTAGLLIGGDWYAIFGSLLAIACIWYAVDFVPVILEVRQASDRSTAFLVCSWACLAAVAVLGLWLALGAGQPTLLTLRLQFAYGFVYVFGWLSLMILGMLYRIVPTHVSKLLAAHGIAAVPGLRQAFIHPGSQIVVLICLVTGLTISTTGILIGSIVLFRIGWGTWLAGMMGFLAALFRLAACRTLGPELDEK